MTGIGAPAVAETVFAAYVARNRVNGKCYIGITSRCVEGRWHEHIIDAARNPRKGALHAAISKYGAESFDVQHVASACNWKNLCEVERVLITQHRSRSPLGYNLTAGGDGVVDLPRETLERIASANRGRKHTPEARQRIGAASRGRQVSAQTRAKLSAAHLGKSLSQEHRAKLSAAKLGKKLPPRTAGHCAKISSGQRDAWGRRRG